MTRPSEIVMGLEEALGLLVHGMQESLAADLAAGDECYCELCGDPLSEKDARIVMAAQIETALVRFRAVCSDCREITYAEDEGGQ